MGGLAEQLMSDALQATFNRDEKLAMGMPERDKQVNRSEVEVDELCRRILALRQPTASDLRFVTFVMKAVTDLERIGDLAVNVADRALALSREPPLPYPQELSRMSELAQDMLHRALDCFVNEDTAAADEIMHSDDKVDDLYWTLFRRVLALMQQDPLRRRACHQPALRGQARRTVGGSRHESGRDGHLHGPRGGCSASSQPCRACLRTLCPAFW